jgi:tetratricopeptide (TPR) repeat protein
MSHQRRPKPLKPRDAKRLGQIETLMARRNWTEAEDALRAFTRKNPDVIDGWLMLMEVGDVTRQTALIWNANRHLLELEPHEETHRYNAAVTSMQLGMPFAAWLHIKAYLARWPNGAHIQAVWEMQTLTESACQNLMETDDMAKGTDPADLARFEESQTLVSSGNIKEGLPLSLLAAQKLPYAAAPRNNISLSYAAEGKLAKAVEITREVLAQYPHNVHARCNLAVYLIRLGRDDEARSVLDALREETPDNPDHWRKLIDAFAHAGDDTALVDVFARATEAPSNTGHENVLDGIMQHLAAVSYARLGNPKEAQRLWKDALRQDPSLQIARENMADARRPVGERNGAWHFAVNQWLTPTWMERLEGAFAAGVKRGEHVTPREVERVLQAIPELDVAMAILLDRGDPTGRELALHIAAHYPLRGLRDFALGQRGTDSQRWEAARYAGEHSLIDTTQPVTLYVQGEPRQLMLLGFEIHDELPEDTLPQQIETYLDASLEALNTGDMERSLAQIDAGLRVIPDNRVLLNQKRLALARLGQQAESDALTRRLAEQYPEYLFARCAMARLLARENNIEEAEQWLASLLQRKRLHYAEFYALAAAQIEVHHAAGRTDAARSWLQMWQQADPDSIPSSLVQLLSEKS